MSRLTPRQLSRRRALPAALLAGALAIPAVTGCEAGLNAPTLAFHPAANGAYATSGDVTISNAFVLGPQLGQQLPAGGQAGLFVSLSAQGGGDQLESVSASGVAASVKVDGTPVSIPASGTANLTGPDPHIVLTGLSAPLSGGQTVTLTFTFASASPVTLKVPVVPQAYDYATFAQPTVAPSATPSGSVSPTPTP